jgi:hypothetical protein
VCPEYFNHFELSDASESNTIELVSGNQRTESQLYAAYIFSMGNHIGCSFTTTMPKLIHTQKRQASSLHRGTEWNERPAQLA